MPDPRGLYRKFDLDPSVWDNGNAVLIAPMLVRRIDDTDECRHAECEYLVLDLYHDPHAAAAIRAYAAAVAAKHPKLAQDLMKLAPLTGKEKG